MIREGSNFFLDEKVRKKTLTAALAAPLMICFGEDLMIYSLGQIFLSFALSCWYPSCVAEVILNYMMV
jgi:hypothetical protein